MKENLSEADYRRNFFGFIWHATFLALSKSFLDTDTVLPALILKSGGNEILIGILTAIMVGSAKFMQLFFAPFISAQKRKKVFMLLAINIRIISIYALAFIILKYNYLTKTVFFLSIFLIIITFSVFGAFGGVAYTDLLGKSIRYEQRMSLFSLKQLFQALGFIISAFAVKVILKKLDFPQNYALSFFIAGLILIIGSLGFWILKEKYIKPKQRKTIWQFFKLIPKEMKQNKSLLYFLLAINILGVSVVFMPFVISLAKDRGILSKDLVGNLLITKMIGVIIGSFSVYLFKHKIKYHFLLSGTAIITAIIALNALFAYSSVVFIMLFFLSGISFSLLRIASEGILIEISNDHNRSEYAGIVGSGNLSGIIFPFIIGGLLPLLGYSLVFILVATLMLLSLFFINRLSC